jgi:hypothetical protein
MSPTIYIRQQVHCTVWRHIVLVPLINHLHNNWILILVGIHELHRFLVWRQYVVVLHSNSVKVPIPLLFIQFFTKALQHVFRDVFSIFLSSANL